MKKNKIRGFTLVEMIIVIAIIGIIMAGLANFFVPIRRVFVESTSYESYRTVQQGMSKYVAENTKYATAESIIPKSSAVSVGNPSVSITVNSAENAKNAFAYMIGARVSGVAQTPEQVALEQTIHVITIDNTTAYKIKNHKYYGRLKMYRYDASSSTFKEYVAMGNSFYDEMSYSIALTPISSPSSGLNIQVTSSMFADTSGDLKKASDSKVITTTDAASYANLSSPVNGIYDLTYFTDSSSSTGFKATTTKGQDTYIVYTTSTY